MSSDGKDANQVHEIDSDAERLLLGEDEETQRQDLNSGGEDNMEVDAEREEESDKNVEINKVVKNQSDKKFRFVENTGEKATCSKYDNSNSISMWEMKESPMFLDDSIFPDNSLIKYGPENKVESRLNDIKHRVYKTKHTNSQGAKIEKERKLDELATSLEIALEKIQEQEVSSSKHMESFNSLLENIDVLDKDTLFDIIEVVNQSVSEMTRALSITRNSELMRYYYSSKRSKKLDKKGIKRSNNQLETVLELLQNNMAAATTHIEAILKRIHDLENQEPQVNHNSETVSRQIQVYGSLENSHIQIGNNPRRWETVKNKEFENKIEFFQKRTAGNNSGASPPKSARLEAAEQPRRVPAPQLFARKEVGPEVNQPVRQNVAPVHNHEPHAENRHDEVNSDQRRPQPTIRHNQPLRSQPRDLIRCIFCNESHFSAVCRNVADINRREQIVDLMGRCKICLKRHLGACRSGHRCRNCGSEEHHQALCVPLNT